MYTFEIFFICMDSMYIELVFFISVIGIKKFFRQVDDYLIHQNPYEVEL